MLSTGLITVQQIAWFVLLTFIHWIAIYLVDSVIQPLNNWAQENFSSSVVISHDNVSTIWSGAQVIRDVKENINQGQMHCLNAQTVMGSAIER